MGSTVTRNVISNRVKKLGLLSAEDQHLVRQFIESIGTLSSRRVSSSRTESSLPGQAASVPPLLLPLLWSG